MMFDSLLFYIAIFILIGYIYAEFDYSKKVNDIKKSKNHLGEKETNRKLEDLKNNRKDDLMNTTITVTVTLFIILFILIYLSGFDTSGSGDTYCYNEAGRKICG